MTLTKLLNRADHLGLTLEPRGGKLAVTPGNRCPPELVDSLREHKAEILALLSRPREPGWHVVPPDSLKLNESTPQPTPWEREQVIGYLLRQTGGAPGPLTKWLVLRECAYFDGPGRNWDCALHAYAAARDAACWQTGREEVDLLDLIDGLDKAADSLPRRAGSN